MKNNTSKSFERSKKSFITIAKILAKGTCTALIPGSGMAFEVAGTLANHVKQIYKDRTENRFQEFHQHILGDGISEKEQREFIEKPITLEDYCSLLSAAIQDDEDKKVQLYANLLRSLAMGIIPQESKVHTIKVAKAITFEEAEFIKKFYIYKKHDIFPETGPSVSASSLLKINNFMDRIKLQNLVRLGIFFEPSSEHFEPTQLLSIIVEGLYEKEALNPDAIQKLTWSGLNIMIVSYRIDAHSNISYKIGELLRKHRIKNITALLNSDEQVKKANIFYQGFIFLLDSNKVPDNYKNVVTKIDSEKVIIKLLLKNSDGTLPQDTFPELVADEVLPVDVNLSDGVNLLEEVIQRYTRAAV